MFKMQLKITSMLYDFREKKLKKLSRKNYRLGLLAVATLSLFILILIISCRSPDIPEEHLTINQAIQEVQLKVSPAQKAKYAEKETDLPEEPSVKPPETVPVSQLPEADHPYSSFSPHPSVSTPRPSGQTDPTSTVTTIGAPSLPPFREETENVILTILASFTLEIGGNFTIDTIEPGIVRVINNKSDVLIPVLLSLHKFNDSSLECSDQLNPTAINDMKGALLLINEINCDKSFLPSIRFGLVFIDSCESYLTAKQRVLKFLKSEGNPVTGSVSVKVAGFISSATRDETKSVIEVLTGYGITLISAQDLTPSGLTLGMNKGIFQVPLAFEQVIAATIEQLKYFNWSCISVVKEKYDVHNEVLYDTLINMATENKICLVDAQEIDSNDLRKSSLRALNNLRTAKDLGSKAVLLLTGFNSTQRLLQSFKDMVAEGSMSRDDFFWILFQESNLNIVRGLEEELMGSLLINEERSNFKNFLNNFGQKISLFMPKVNKLRQIGPKADWTAASRQLDVKSTLNTMQGIIALVSGFARLRDNYCGDDTGLCPRLVNGSNLRNKLNYYIQYTASMKLDAKESQLFSFKRSGFGAKTVDVLNFRRDLLTEKFFFEKVGQFYDRFERIGNTSYVTYDERGFEVPLLDLNITSNCAPTVHCINSDVNSNLQV